MTGVKPVEGRKVVFGFLGAMGLLAAVGFVVVIFLRAQPVVQTKQRSLARLLANAYQKYRYDVQSWPTDAFDAAMNFKSENAELPTKVREAEKEWGLKATLTGTNGDSPTVKFTFEKPSPLELTYSLYNRERRKR